MKKHIVIALIAVSCSLGIQTAAVAQTDRETQILEAFYSKDELVTATTRFPMPRNWIADNIMVITAEQIEAMGVHTVAEVLKSIPGVFIYSNQEFGAASLISVQGSEDRHVLVLLDGVRWNFLSGGNAETNTIPVDIIDRIEVIKGPASSAWGSALGGLINIITRPAGMARTPSGILQVSYGEAGSLDAGAHLSGKAGALGYHLFAGRQESGGLRNDRDFENIHLFSKFSLQLPDDNVLSLSMGYSEPENDLGAITSQDIATDTSARNYFANAVLDTAISDAFKLKAAAFINISDTFLDSSTLGLRVLGADEEPYRKDNYKERNSGGSGQLIWLSKNQTIVLGTEMFHGHLDHTNRSGSFLQSYGAPAIKKTASSVDEWALYINDTILFGKLSVTPGLRFDYNTVSGSFISPNLGATYQTTTGALIRGTVSRGFQYPPLSLSSGGGLFLDPNPDLAPEEVWSYQLGLETAAFRSRLIRINLFYYRQRDLLERELYGGGPPANNDIMINKRSGERHGVEAEYKSKPVYHVAFSGGGAYIRKESPEQGLSGEMWTAYLMLEYDNKKSIMASLRGNYVDWDPSAFLGAGSNHFLWDFTIQKKIVRGGKRQPALFFTAHNLFDESQYYASDYKNPSRWVEIGFKWEY